MLTNAAAPSPSTALAGAVEGPSSSETRAANAADFLALLGHDKAAGKKLAKTKGGPLAASATKSATAAAETKTDTKSATSVAAEAAKAAADAKLEGETGKAQTLGAVPAAILAALAANTNDKSAKATAPTGQAVTATEAAIDEPAKVKAKPARPGARRESEPAAKSETAKPAETAPDANRIAKVELHQSAAAAAKASETPASAIALAVQPDVDPQGQPLAADAQVTETRIPLATREAAQTGFAAPVLAMRTVTTKDGITKSIEIRLDPAELGQVDVKLETGHDGKLQAVVSAENADAFELLKKDSGALEAALREAGVELGDGGVTFALNDSGADQSQQREAAYGGAAARKAIDAGERTAAAVETSSWRNGVIDISV